MGNIGKRIDALEAARPAQPTKYHRIIWPEYIDREAAIEAYGRDKIGANDGLIFRKIVEFSSKVVPIRPNQGA